MSTPSQSVAVTSAPITERKFLVPFALVTSLFFLWAFGVNLNDILIPHLKKVFNLTDFRSSLIQTAFFGGYFLSAVPAGMRRRLGPINRIRKCKNGRRSCESFSGRCLRRSPAKSGCL